MITRLLAVARITFLELIRSRCLWVVALIVLVQGATLYFMRDANIEARGRTLQGSTLLAINVFGLLGALVLAGGTIPRDLERRHLYFVFVKPLRNWEFLVGKTLGVWAILLVITGATAVSLLGMMTLAEGNSKVRARTRAAVISSEVKGYLNQDNELQLPFNHVTPQGHWKFSEDISKAHTISWLVPGLMPGAHVPAAFHWLNGVESIRTEPVAEAGKVIVPVPAGAKPWTLKVMRRTRENSGAVAMSASLNGQSIDFITKSVDSDFSVDGASLVVDLKSLMPGSAWDLEVVCRGQKTRRRIKSRAKHRIDLPASVGPEKQIDLSISLVGGDRTGFTVHPKRLWVEGRQHPVIDNVIRGFGIAWLHLSAVSAVTLIASVFLTQPTSMLLGFTFFVLSHSLSTLSQVPEILFFGGSLRPGQDIPVQMMDNSSYQALSTFVEWIVAALPDFARFSPGEFFQRGEHITMGAFWNELSGSLVVLTCCVVAGSLFVIRKEFLK